MKKWLADHWFEIVSLKFLAGGSLWYLYFANNAVRAALGTALFLAVIAAFEQLIEIRKSEPGSEDIIVFEFEFLIAALVTVILNLVATASYVVYAAVISGSFSFLARQEFWADTIGSNCLILLILFVAPTTIFRFFYRETEKTDFSFYVAERGFPY